MDKCWKCKKNLNNCDKPMFGLCEKCQDGIEADIRYAQEDIASQMLESRLASLEARVEELEQASNYISVTQTAERMQDCVGLKLDKIG